MHLAAIALALVVLTLPFAAEAQQARTVRIGYVYPTLLPHIVAFKHAVRDLGYVEGRHVIFEERAFGSSPPAKVQEIVAALIPDMDLLVVWGTVAATAAKKVTTTLPTLFLSVGDPVATGLVPNLARPGGNMTGVTFEAAAETYGKRLHLLKEIVPDLTRVAVLRPVGDPNAVIAVASLERAAQTLAVQLMSVDVRSAKDLDPAFAEITRKGAQGIMVVAGAFTVSNGPRIADLALRTACHRRTFTSKPSRRAACSVSGLPCWRSRVRAPLTSTRSSRERSPVICPLSSRRVTSCTST